MREWTPERRQKAAQTQAALAAAYAAQTIVIDKNWQIRRVDALNWEIQFKGQFWGYYGTLPDALRTLPAKMLGEAAKNSLADVLGSQKAILATIEQAIKDRTGLLALLEDCVTNMEHSQPPAGCYTAGLIQRCKEAIQP
jgi:hypothetical protein